MFSCLSVYLGVLHQCWPSQRFWYLLWMRYSPKAFQCRDDIWLTVLDGSFWLHAEWKQGDKLISLLSFQVQTQNDDLELVATLKGMRILNAGSILKFRSTECFDRLSCCIWEKKESGFWKASWRRESWLHEMKDNAVQQIVGETSWSEKWRVYFGPWWAYWGTGELIARNRGPVSRLTFHKHCLEPCFRNGLMRGLPCHWCPVITKY